MPLWATKVLSEYKGALLEAFALSLLLPAGSGALVSSVEVAVLLRLLLMSLLVRFDLLVDPADNDTADVAVASVATAAFEDDDEEDDEEEDDVCSEVEDSRSAAFCSV